MVIPLLTEADPAEKSEGGLDPLGLEPIADALGTRLVPGVRERQSHPRYLTLIAAGLAICERFQPGEIAKDGVSDAQRVFEWYVVEGLVRSSPDRPRGVPGSQKAASAIDARVPLSAGRYLKTPSVFGFHGVYRLLARTLGVESGGRLGEFGYQLLNVWSREQGLQGFYGTEPGPGTAERDKLFRAVEDGMRRGSTDRSPMWDGWAFFRQHFAPLEPGVAEADTIRYALTQDRTGFREPVWHFLTSVEGQRIWKGADGSEREFHTALRATVDGELGLLLSAISLYEQFCRLCQDAFDDCLYEMSRLRSKVGSVQLARLSSVVRASRELPGLCAELEVRLAVFGQSDRFRVLCTALGTGNSPQEWVERLTSHHRENQRRKPPDGKLPWFERFDDGTLIIRPLYLREQGGRGDNRYVHSYRTASLWSFATDLKAFTR